MLPKNMAGNPEKNRKPGAQDEVGVGSDWRTASVPKRPSPGFRASGVPCELFFRLSAKAYRFPALRLLWRAGCLRARNVWHAVRLWLSFTGSMPDHRLEELETELAALDEEDIVSEKHVDLLNAIGWEIGMRDVARANDLARRAFEIAEQLSYKRGIAQSRLNLAFADYAAADYQSALSKGREALSIFEEIGDREGVGNALLGSGLVHWSLGDYEVAVDDLHRSIELFEAADNPQRKSWAMTSLGGLYESIGDLDKAVEYHEKKPPRLPRRWR